MTEHLISHNALYNLLQIKSIEFSRSTKVLIYKKGKKPYTFFVDILTYIYDESVIFRY